MNRYIIAACVVFLASTSVYQFINSPLAIALYVLAAMFAYRGLLEYFVREK